MRPIWHLILAVLTVALVAACDVPTTRTTEQDCKVCSSWTDIERPYMRACECPNEETS